MTVAPGPDCGTPEVAPTAEATRLSASLAWVEDLVAEGALIRATKWESYSLNGMLWIHVIGAQYEAHAWHVAVGGRAFGSHIDSRGVRRQMIIGTRVCVEVVDDPRERGESRG
jgi:hypothetical protein